MTGHLLFEAIDPAAAITVSARGVRDVIRGHIGFDGLLLSDDLSMQALGGTLGERAARALAAGCDIALHCNGRMDEMTRDRGQHRPDDRAGRPAVRRPAAASWPAIAPRSARPGFADAGRRARRASPGMGIRRGQIQWRQALRLDYTGLHERTSLLADDRRTDSFAAAGPT